MTDYSDILSDLNDMSLFQSPQGYVLPGAQTSIKPSETDTEILLYVKTTRPATSEFPGYGHDPALVRLIENHRFRSR